MKSILFFFAIIFVMFTAAFGQSGRRVQTAQQPPVQLTVNPTTAGVGVPFTFTITPTTGALISNITIDYGDGQRDELGAISTQTTRQHPYQSPGAKVVTVTQRETNGNVTTATVTVTVTS